VLLNRADALLTNHLAVARWLIVLAAVVAFGGTLGNGFVYDDGRQVLENPFVRNPHLVGHIFTGPVWSFLGAAAETNFYRPLHIFSHFLVWQLAGANPAAFHLYQLIFYVINGFLVFRLGRDMLQNTVAAFGGALLWVLHPLHVEPLCWIAGVPDCGCGLFFVLAFLIFLRGGRAPKGRWAWHLFGAFIYFLALLFKEMAISLPVLLGVYWFVMMDAESWRRKAHRGLPYVAAAAAYIGLRIVFLGHVSHAPHFWIIRPRVALAAVALLGQHTKLFFWPADLNDFRNFDLVESSLSPWPWITLLALGAAVLLRKRNPPLCFLILWWPVTLLPCLDIRQLSYPLLAERFSYLPSVGLCLAVAYIALQSLPALVPNACVARSVVPAFGLALLSFCVQDLRAVPRWRDNDTLWGYSFRVAPKTALVHVHRALDLQYRYNDFAGATAEFETAIALNQAAFVALPAVTYDCLIGLGQIASVRGNTKVALEYFQKAIDLTPGYSAAYDVMGSVYFPRGEYARAADYFQQAVHANPLDMSARFFLGTCFVKLGKPALAAEQFHAARMVDPNFLQAVVAEASALDAAGDKEGAARVRREMRSP
jgi:tetratricopeptide (TPR) repeat protein